MGWKKAHHKCQLVKGKIQFLVPDVKKGQEKQIPWYLVFTANPKNTAMNLKINDRIS